MYGYIYETTNKINGKKYIGQKAASEFVESYKGSGVELKKDIKLFGKENFETIILCTCESAEELDRMEIEYIKEFDAVNSNNYYNLASGGQGFTKGGKFSEDHIKKISESKMGDKNPQYKKTPNEAQMNALKAGQKLPASKKQKEKVREMRTGSVTSDYTKGLLSDSIKGRKFMNDGISVVKQVKPEDFDYYLSLGWVFGMKIK